MRRAAGLLATLALAGCGGGGDRLSREDFAERADAICRENQREATPRPTSFAGFPNYAARVGPLVQKNVAEIEKLEPPEEDEDAVERLLAAMRAKVEAFSRLREAAAAGDEAAQQDAIDDGVAADEDARRAADELGLEVCGTA